MKITSSMIRDSFEICSPNGETKKIIPFCVNLTQVGQRINHSLEKVQKNINEDSTELGNAIYEMFNLLFGPQTTQEILDFYSDDYVAMLCDILPVITEVIIPQINAWNEKIHESKKRIKF